MKPEREIILSIETAIEGGSISILDGGLELDFWKGGERISKAEDILEQLARLLDKNEIKKDSLSLIAVSSGPGSATGLKIGCAIAAGLERALGCEVIEASILDALAQQSEQSDFGFASAKIIAAVSIGINLICRQVFESRGNSEMSVIEEPTVSTYRQFSENIELIKPIRIICAGRLGEIIYDLIPAELRVSKFIEIFDGNFAYLIGKQVSNLASDNVITALS